jgi:hypothetical protein
MQSLRTLDVLRTRVTGTGAGELRKALPKCRIFSAG